MEDLRRGKIYCIEDEPARAPSFSGPLVEQALWWRHRREMDWLDRRAAIWATWRHDPDSNHWPGWRDDCTLCVPLTPVEEAYCLLYDREENEGELPTREERHAVLLLSPPEDRAFWTCLLDLGGQEPE